MDTPRWSSIDRFKSRWFAHGVTSQGYETSSSGGDINPYKYWTGEECKGYAQEALDGALVYDGIDVLMNDVIEHVFRGPMLSVRLASYEYSNMLDDTKSLPSFDVDFSLASLRATYNITGFSTVGIGIYEHLLRAIPNMKFGRVYNGKVVWEDGYCF